MNLPYVPNEATWHHQEVALLPTFRTNRKLILTWRAMKNILFCKDKQLKDSSTFKKSMTLIGINKVQTISTLPSPLLSSLFPFPFPKEQEKRSTVHQSGGEGVLGFYFNKRLLLQTLYANEIMSVKVYILVRFLQIPIPNCTMLK